MVALPYQKLCNLKIKLLPSGRTLCDPPGGARVRQEVGDKGGVITIQSTLLMEV